MNELFYENAAECPACLSRFNGVDGDECSDVTNPIGRTFLSGKRIFAETGKSRLSVKSRPVGGELHFRRLERWKGPISF
jgi:hypothetical protein